MADCVFQIDHGNLRHHRFWQGKLSEADLLSTADKVQADAWELQRDTGIAAIGLDGTLYDQVLDTVQWLGVIPARFKGLSGLQRYFAMARGAPGRPALDMTKLMDTNYHFLVPELDANFSPEPNYEWLVDKVAKGQAVLGAASAIPIVMGPVTFVCLAKGCPVPTDEAVRRLLPAYTELLRRLAGMRVPEVQMHEPILATSGAGDLRDSFEAAYLELAKAGVPLHLVTYYDDIGSAYPWAVNLPVSSVTLDFLGVPGAAVPNQTLQLIRQHGFPADKRLGAGVVDGRSVWADDGTAVSLVTELLGLGIPHERLVITSSAPLQHLPYDLRLEGGHLPEGLAGRLAFATQKLAEIVSTATAVAVAAADPGSAHGDAPGAVKPQAGAAGAAAGSGEGVAFGQQLDEKLFSRSEAYKTRREAQATFPAFPTTTIGSFPQTAEVRRLRQQLQRGALSRPEYERLITGHIAHCVGVQEALGLDVLVHGESERTDMVEYFGTQLGGMWHTSSGWVQSYGSRCVRPPVVVGDIEYQGPMAVWEYQVAQTYTRRPVKGMLTGPVTILNWSFPRKDISRQQQAMQLALALRKEVAALEEAGCKVVQVDEPALREGLPLKAERWGSYLGWAVDAFRLCTAVAGPATQIVTHLCYSDFNDILPAIDRMDADVLTIENSRSDNAMIRALATAGYRRDIGPGVYDVHSPEVPSVEFIKSRIRSFLDSGILPGRPDRIWVNPDCGLKTRGWPETIAALRNMVQAAAEARAELSEGASSGAGSAAGGVGAEQVCKQQPAEEAVGLAGRSCGGCCR
ncbi:METE protein [Gonium pectorale]|uniref:5-methyltetrahydropteroyltriglutamate--homocysteine S-methyltransferase n=1 Tax=Gonium pectorale TaxID=33097 RepID=A0A150H418_GONPE|nr:METE protein [Gonium pectorale]|eukprot:KXZ56801.1 METE protein [Gonium pectorale]